MSKVLRASAAVVAAVVAVPLWGVPTAYADTSTLTASAAGYFNSDGIRKPDQSPAAPPNLTNSADGVAPEHLAVAARGGQENKVSFLLFDLFELDPAATISKAVLTVPLAPNSDGNVSLSPAPEKVIACPAGEGGFLGDDGVALQDAPARKCDVAAVKAVPTADGAAYAFDVTAMAQGWLEMNDGLALTSEPSARATAFQTVFKPATEAKLALTFTAPPSTLDDFDSFLEPATTTTTSGTPDLGTTTFDPGVTTSDPGFGAVAEPVLTADVPVTAPESAAAEPVAAPAAATVPAAAMTDPPLTPAPAFWLGLLALAGGLLFLALIMGDPRVPQASARQSRLSQALQARQRGAAGSAPGLRSARPALNF